MDRKIEYLSIVKEAINITKNNKILWWFGLLSIFGGISFSFNGNFSGNSDKNNFDEMTYANMVRRFSFYWENYSQWIILVGVIIIAICIAFYILGIIGRGALLDSIIKVCKNEKITFSSGFKKGVKLLKQIFLLNITFAFVFLIFIFILVFPIVRLILLESYGIAIFLGLIALMLIISISILFFYLAKYALIYLVNNNSGVFESIKLAYRLFEKNIKESFIMGLVMIAIGLIFGMIVGFIFVAFLIPGGIAGIMVYKLFGKVAVIFLVIFLGLILVAMTFLMSAVLNVFSQTTWFLFFVEIAKNKNYEESLEINIENEKIIKNPEPESNI